MTLILISIYIVSFIIVMLFSFNDKSKDEIIKIFLMVFPIVNTVTAIVLMFGKLDFDDIDI